MMTDSHRVPGYPMRYVGTKKLDEDALENVHKHDVNGDGERGIPVRTAEASDAKETPRSKPSPLF